MQNYAFLWFIAYLAINFVENTEGVLGGAFFFLKNWGECLLK